MPKITTNNIIVQRLIETIIPATTLLILIKFVFLNLYVNGISKKIISNKTEIIVKQSFLLLWL